MVSAADGKSPPPPPRLGRTNSTVDNAGGLTADSAAAAALLQENDRKINPYAGCGLSGTNHQGKSPQPLYHLTINPKQPQSGLDRLKKVIRH